MSLFKNTSTQGGGQNTSLFGNNLAGQTTGAGGTGNQPATQQQGTGKKI